MYRIAEESNIASLKNKTLEKFALVLPKLDVEYPKLISPLVALVKSLYYYKTGPLREKFVEHMVDIEAFTDEWPSRDEMLHLALENPACVADVIKTLGRRDRERKSAT